MDLFALRELKRAWEVMVFSWSLIMETILMLELCSKDLKRRLNSCWLYFMPDRERNDGPWDWNI